MSAPDLQFSVPGPPGLQYSVAAKIVDTVQGNSDISGLLIGGNLSSGGVDNSNSGVVTPPQHPYLYRMEVQATEPNTQTMSKYSVLYGF
jgi:hypothetical protein